MGFPCADLTGAFKSCLIRPFDMRNTVQTIKCTALIHRGTMNTSAWQWGSGFSGEMEEGS
jgi:hypothetical protein